VAESPEGFSQSTSEHEATIRLDGRIYSREAVLRTCHAFTDVLYVHVPESADSNLTIQLRLKITRPSLEHPNPTRIEDAVGEFCNSLLEFELRRQVEQETASVRQLLIAKAFSESGILEEDPPGAISDPVGFEAPSSVVQIRPNSGPLVKIAEP